MKEFMRTKKGMANILAALAVLVCACVYLLYTGWYDRRAMFHNVTVELGTESLSIQEFMNPAARGDRVDFVTDYREVDLGHTGQTEITLSYGGREETVTLTVQDTVAPAAVVETSRIVDIDDVPEAWELVSNVTDASPVTIYYAQEPVISVDYSDVTVTVVVEDSSGNKFEQDCVFSYRWLRDNYTMELGDILTAEKLLMNPQRDMELLNQVELNQVNSGGVGEYVVTAALGDREAACMVMVQDTQGPDLELQSVHRHPGGFITLDHYIASVSDPSGDVEVRMVGEAPDNSQKGKHTVVIEAEDKYGNVTRKETTLWIGDDVMAPNIRGAYKTITIEKYAEPDFLEGITAYDGKDGTVEVTVDTSKLDVTVAGTYYITYTATDASGNEATAKRKVEVNHDAEDTAALVREIADSLPNDPEEIRDYVRSTIRYDTNWGGDDPVWYGFTKHNGNCYVHALCLQSLLELKGYETQMIWVTNKTHYWLIIKLGENWRHIDATPSPQHAKISLMNDEDRLANLNGRVWDFEQWPACE